MRLADNVRSIINPATGGVIASVPDQTAAEAPYPEQYTGAAWRCGDIAFAGSQRPVYSDL